MKRLFMIAALAVAAFTAKAHNFHNDSPCDVEFRVVCIDPLTCTVTSVASGWTVVTAGGMAPLPAAACMPPDEMGYEVQYAGSSGCSGSGSVIVKHDLGMYSTNNCGMNNLPLPGCSCSPTGLNVHINPDNVHVHPL